MCVYVCSYIYIYIYIYWHQCPATRPPPRPLELKSRSPNQPQARCKAQRVARALIAAPYRCLPTKISQLRLPTWISSAAGYAQTTRLQSSATKSSRYVKNRQVRNHHQDARLAELANVLARMEKDGPERAALMLRCKAAEHARAQKAKESLVGP